MKYSALFLAGVGAAAAFNIGNPLGSTGYVSREGMSLDLF
jgi:hypothetical protein